MFGVINYAFETSHEPEVSDNTTATHDGNFRQRQVTLDRFVGTRFRSCHGCWGCRKRRKKCDETRPACNACVARKQPCVWRDAPRPEEPAEKRRQNEAKGARKSGVAKPKSGSFGAAQSSLSDRMGAYSRGIALVSPPAMPAEPRTALPSPAPMTFTPAIEMDLPEADWGEEENEREDDIGGNGRFGQESENDAQDSRNEQITTVNPINTIHTETGRTNSVQEAPANSVDFDGIAEISASQSLALELATNSVLPVPAANHDTQAILPLSHALFGDGFYYVPPPLLAFFNIFLDSKGVSFVRHFESQVSNALTVSPSTSNYFSKTFLLLATVDESIGHAIASWGAFYVHQYHHVDVQRHLFRAMSLVAERFPHGSKVSTYDYFTLLCFHLIVLGFYVCQGDVDQWWTCFQKCAELVQRAGGLRKLCMHLEYSNDIKFLVSNFFYHDVLSSHAFLHGPAFSLKDYQEVFEPGYYDNSYGIDPLQGCMNPVYMLLAEELEVRCAMRTRRERLESLLNEELGAEDDPSVLQEFELMRTLYLEYCEMVIRQIEDQIADCLIDELLLEKCNDEEVRIHVQIFAVFKLFCKVYWVLFIKGTPPLANESQLLFIQLMDKIDSLIDTRMIVVLCLPLLGAGTLCYTTHDRRRMEDMFHKVINRCPIHNVHRAWVVVQEIWKRNPKGELCVDWADVCEDYGWQLCVC